MKRPAGIVDFTPDPALFPFESRWFDSSVGPVHYVDEGQGQTLLLLHGNPDWSFLYRKIISRLRDRFRCISMDYPGFGLSVHPQGYGYTPAEHSQVLAELVQHLDLRDMVLMGQDWGGPIGMELASRQPERIAGLVMGNTFCWPATDRFPKTFSRVLGSGLGQHLIKQHNVFVTVLMRRMLQAPITEAEFAHYTQVVPTPESRQGIAVFPEQITGAEAWLGELEQRVRGTLLDKPLLLLHGRKDPGFGKEAHVQRWRALFPEASHVELPQAGHFIQEDAPVEIAEAISEMFGQQTPT